MCRAQAGYTQAGAEDVVQSPPFGPSRLLQFLLVTFHSDRDHICSFDEPPQAKTDDGSARASDKTDSNASSSLTTAKPGRLVFVAVPLA